MAQAQRFFLKANFAKEKLILNFTNPIYHLHLPIQTLSHVHKAHAFKVYKNKFNSFLSCWSAVFRPISADAKLRMNPRSDVDFSSPKVDLTVNLSEVAIELNRCQVDVCILNRKLFFGSNLERHRETFKTNMLLENDF